MRNFLLSVVTLVSMVFNADAVAYMTIEKNDGTIVRYDVEKVKQVYYEEDLGVTVSGKVGDYSYVDLGLESGTKWAIYNVGASKPNEYGNYFAWGETSPKESYYWSNYKYEKESYKDVPDGKNLWAGCNKYTIADGYNEVVDSVAWYDSKGNFIGDNILTLLSEDDVATANWGDSWRMPTSAELKELVDGCDWEWTDDFNGSGVAGRVGTSKANGNTIFLPAAGCFSGNKMISVGSDGCYWSSSLFINSSYAAYYLYFVNTGNLSVDYFYRNYGHTVRAVAK